MIVFEDVCKQFETGFQLSNINFHLKKGDMLFLTGKSGSGKSTLIKLILGFETITQGKISVDGRSLAKISASHLKKLRESIGVISQAPTFLTQKTVYENVCLPLIIRGLHKEEINTKARGILQKLGLLTKKNLPIKNLSVSEQQYVNIARALVIEPKILLADEPTNHLDHLSSATIYQLFEDCNQSGTSLFVVTHDLPKIASMKFPILCLKNGKIMQETNNG